MCCSFPASLARSLLLNWSTSYHRGGSQMWSFLFRFRRRNGRQGWLQCQALSHVGGRNRSAPKHRCNCFVPTINKQRLHDMTLSHEIERFKVVSCNLVCVFHGHSFMDPKRFRGVWCIPGVRGDIASTRVIRAAVQLRLKVHPSSETWFPLAPHPHPPITRALLKAPVTTIAKP